LKRAQSNSIYGFFYKLCSHELFSFLILLLILLNTVILALDRYPLGDNERVFLETFNDALSLCFFGEMIVKLMGLGVKGYAKDRFNLFDCLIVVVSMLEILLYQANLAKSVSSGGAISAFRAIRLLRVFKLARSWKGF